MSLDIKGPINLTGRLALNGGDGLFEAPVIAGTDSTTSSITVSLTLSSDDRGRVVDFTPRYRLSGDTDWTSNSNVASNTTSYEYAGLVADTSYELEVLANLANGDIVPSNVIEEATAAVIPATWNPDDKNSNVVLSNGNFDANINTTGTGAVRGTQGYSSGKRYFEITTVVVGAISIRAAGIADATAPLNQRVGNAAQGWGHLANANKVNNGNVDAYGTVWDTVNDVLMVAVDLDAGRLWWGKNGTWFASGNPATAANPSFTGISGTQYPMCSIVTSTTAKLRGNFGGSAFAYTPPVGFEAWDHQGS